MVRDFITDVQKLNEFVAEHGNRNPDELIKMPFNQWCAIAHTTLVIKKERKAQQDKEAKKMRRKKTR